MTRSIPLVILATIDPILRETALLDLLTDSPGVVAVCHDILDDGDGGMIRRVVMDGSGLIEDSHLPLEHECLSCAVREDALPTLARLADADRWSAAVLALPVTANPLPISRALSAATGRGGSLSRLRLASVIGVHDVGHVEDDLLGGDLLAERGIELAEDDRRTVGEALVAQLGHADVVVAVGDPAVVPVGSDLVEHLRGAGSRRIDGLHEIDPQVVFAGRHDPVKAARRVDPMHVRPGNGPREHGVWSLELRSDRPFHPERLVEQIRRLGSGGFRSLGHFWVPTRPHSACGWDGAGGQLSIGELGPWDHRAPGTRLVYTGVGDERLPLVEAFEDLLLTRSELDSGLGRWLGREDVLAPWLGDRAPSAW